MLETFRILDGRIASPSRSFDHRVASLPTDAKPELGARIEELLGPLPAAIDEIVCLSGAEPGAIQLILLGLDLAGRLDCNAGNKVVLNGA